MMKKREIGRATLGVIIGFTIYEIVTAVLQFILLVRGDLLEIGFDLLFILLLVFYYDLDALVLLIELIPFIDILPLFVIYMLYKISTADRPRRPLLDLLLKASRSEKVVPTGNWGVLGAKDKIYRATSADEVCVICMQSLRDQDEVITCENGHLAHVKHIQPWTEAMDRGYCPLCLTKYPRVLISKTYRKNL
ncbi:MAG: hypothetical protein LUQ65_11310 [Candidatus Helarchaeota archaeon]|nr:hypothetical protein [Candidatus Helarchaeota archaeon]